MLAEVLLQQRFGVGGSVPAAARYQEPQTFQQIAQLEVKFHNGTKKIKLIKKTSACGWIHLADNSLGRRLEGVTLSFTERRCSRLSSVSSGGRRSASSCWNCDIVFPSVLRRAQCCQHVVSCVKLSVVIMFGVAGFLYKLRSNNDSNAACEDVPHR